MNNKENVLHTTEYGSGDQVVLLLHGLGSRGKDWQFQIDELKDCYRVVTVDFPGHGESEACHQPISMAFLAQKVHQVLRGLALEKVHVVGLSLGGMVAFQLAVDYPDSLSSMVIINSAPGPGDNAKKLKRQLRLRQWIIRLVGLKRLASKIANNLFPLASQAQLRQMFFDSIEKVDKASYLNIASAIERFNLDGKVEFCQIPTLVLTADKDYTSVAFKQAFVDRMPNATLQIVPQSRHASPIDSPEFCNAAIKKFLLEQA